MSKPTVQKLGYRNVHFMYSKLDGSGSVIETKTSLKNLNLCNGHFRKFFDDIKQHRYTSSKKQICTYRLYKPVPALKGSVPICGRVNPLGDIMLYMYSPLSCLSYISTPNMVKNGAFLPTVSACVQLLLATILSPPGNTKF